MFAWGAQPFCCPGLILTKAATGLDLLAVFQSLSIVLAPCLSDYLLASAGGGERLVWLLTPLVVAALLQVLCAVQFKQNGGDQSSLLLVHDERGFGVLEPPCLSWQDRTGAKQLEWLDV